MNQGDIDEEGKKEQIQGIRGFARSPSLGHPDNLKSCEA